MFSEQISWRGIVTITVRKHPRPLSDAQFKRMVVDGYINEIGRIVDKSVINNLIVDGGRNLIRDGLRGAVTDTKIKYMAWGTSGTAANAGQTQLVSESGRLIVTRQIIQLTGETLTTTYMPPAAGAGVSIQELGWFAGVAAGPTINSGVMVARILYSRAKTNLESIQIDRLDRIG